MIDEVEMCVVFFETRLTTCSLHEVAGEGQSLMLLELMHRQRSCRLELLSASNAEKFLQSTSGNMVGRNESMVSKLSEDMGVPSLPFKHSFLIRKGPGSCSGNRPFPCFGAVTVVAESWPIERLVKT